jgi:hypothetical protein
MFFAWLRQLFLIPGQAEQWDLFNVEPNVFPLTVIGDAIVEDDQVLEAGHYTILDRGAILILSS